MELSLAHIPLHTDKRRCVYCDQRENRWHIAALALNKRVLDLCCYHGGFSLVQGSAAEAVGVDSSPHTIATCPVNAELIHCSEKVTWHQPNIADFLAEQYLARERYDIVIHNTSALSWLQYAAPCHKPPARRLAYFAHFILALSRTSLFTQVSSCHIKGTANEGGGLSRPELFPSMDSAIAASSWLQICQPCHLPS